MVNKEKIKIGVDIDEILVEFVKGYFNYLILKGYNVVDYDDIYSYNLWEVLGIEKELSMNLAKEFSHSDYFKNLDFVQFSKEGVEFLIEYFDVYFITARHVSLKQKTIDLLSNVYRIIEPKIFFSGEIYGYLKSKKDICLENNIRYIIEDNFEYSVLYAKCGISVLLLNKPWNKMKECENILKFDDWKGIIKYLRVLNE